MPNQPPIAALALSHGAGSNCNAPLLVALDEAFTAKRVAVTRFDLSYRQARKSGPPRAGDPERDRASIREVVLRLRSEFPGIPVYGGGHSYGGRQTSILAAEEPSFADGLLLLSYPLHPPKRRDLLRVDHFPQLRTPVLFVHGTRDPFGSPDEMTPALKLIRARHELRLFERAGHELLNYGKSLVPEIVSAFLAFFQLRDCV
jgi:predicted alpha/beta-hydrolase family hydrolase